MSRREEFRRARQGVLNACGSNTMRFQAQQVLPLHGPTDTIADAPEACRSPLMLVESQHLRHPLKIGLNTIGRLPDNDVVIADPHVSRRHCTIVVHASQVCELHDTASKNGLLVNGQKIAGPTRLKTGDEIGMGDLVLTFVDLDHPAGSGSHHGGRTSLSA